MRSHNSVAVIVGLEGAASVVAVLWKHAEELDGGEVASERAEGFGMLGAAWWVYVGVVFYGEGDVCGGDSEVECGQAVCSRKRKNWYALYGSVSSDRPDNGLCVLISKQAVTFVVVLLVLLQNRDKIHFLL